MEITGLSRCSPAWDLALYHLGKDNTPPPRAVGSNRGEKKLGKTDLNKNAFVQTRPVSLKEREQII